MFNVSIRDGRPTLGTQMKSVGEVMAIGRTFKEALWKGMRSLETGKAFGSEKFDKALVTARLITPTPLVKNSFFGTMLFPNFDVSSLCLKMMALGKGSRRSC